MNTLIMIGTRFKTAPIIPISAQLQINTEVLLDYIVRIPQPKRDLTSPPRMALIRSFDVNKPGAELKSLKGGVVGGTLLHGVLRIGDVLEIRPGIIVRDPDTSVIRHYTPLRTRVVSLFAEQNALTVAVPGGLIGVGTTLDPSLCRGDRIAGHVLGLLGTLPPVFLAIEIKYKLLSRVLGAHQDQQHTETVITPLQKKEHLMLHVGCMCTGAEVVAVKTDKRRAKLLLSNPVCANEKDCIAISRRIGSRWRLIGCGSIVRGTPLATSE